MRVAFALCGALLTVCLLAAGLQDLFREWKPVQSQYRELAMARAENNLQREAATRLVPGIQQDYLTTLDRTDRCRTCHLGTENPSMDGVPQPYTRHPGTLLETHPPARYGCTVCHRGQGLATTAKEAHARKISFWEEPMLEAEFVQASCERCHRGVEIADAALLNDGRRIFEQKGCAGCHKVYGRGGSLGPELTGVGKASIYVKHPIPENLEIYKERSGGDLNLGYIMEAIEAPAAQPPNTTMPRYDLSSWEVRALTVYVKSLTDEDVPSAYMPRDVYQAPEPSGQDLFVQYCSACHGKNGEGGIRVGRMGTSLNNEELLALASPQFLRGVIRNGRNSQNKVMPAWRQDAGGLADGEISKLVGFILSWKRAAPTMEAVFASAASMEEGQEIYQRNCADCHGMLREGKIGPSLLAPEFLQVASTRFLYETLTKGRPGTAMPGWSWLNAKQIHALIQFLESHDTPNTPASAVSRNGDRRQGARVYRGRCATCHGLRGEGGIGPSLDSPELALLADDGFLVATLVNGRKDSGMPAWSQLSAGDLSALIAHLRTLGTATSLGPVPSGRGDPRNGKLRYGSVCAKCHGTVGEGGTGPAIGAPEFLETASDRLLTGMIKYGRSGTEMRPMGLVVSSLADFTDQEILDVAAYLRTLEPAQVVRQSIRGSVDSGGEWYGRVCSKCHGERGRGGTGPALANPYFLAAASDGFLQATMALGRSQTEMRPMTRHGSGIVELDRAKINDIIAYLRYQSETYGMEKILAQTAFGSEERGKQWFEPVCAQCHGERGRGTEAAPGLNDQNFLAYASDGFLQGTMIRGRPHTGMRSFSLHGDGIASLTAGDVTDVVSYIRSWVRLENEAREQEAQGERLASSQ